MPGATSAFNQRVISPVPRLYFFFNVGGRKGDVLFIMHLMFTGVWILLFICSVRVTVPEQDGDSVQ